MAVGPGSGRLVGRAERAARRFFLIAALILVAISLSALLAPLLLSIPPRVTGAISWRPTALGAIVLAGLLLWELRGAWLILLAGACLFELPPLFTQHPSLTMLATLSQTLLVGIVVGFVGTVVLRLSRSADAAGVSRERAAAAAAAAAGASAARARAAALVHDEVLSTLSLTASPHLVARDRLAEQAARASALLADASEDEPPASTVEALREDALAIDPSVAFEASGFEAAGLGAAGSETPGSRAADDPAAALDLPADVLSVLRGAVRQALRNSLLHAGHSARRRVTVERIDTEHVATEHGPASGRGFASLRVIVADDGVGFIPAQVSLQRLGLRTTAQAVRSVGGGIEVSSGSGSGTRVRIEWPGRNSQSAPHAQHPRPAPRSPAVLPAQTELPRLGNVPLVQVGVTIAATAFAVTQTMLAAVSIATATPQWVPFAVLALLFVSALLLQHRYATRLGITRTVLVLCLICLAMVCGLLGAPFEVGDLWFAGGAAFLLTALAFRGRPLGAAIGGLLLSAMLVLSGAVEGAPPFMIVSVSVRPLGVTAFAVGLALAVAALLRHIAREFAEAESESAREAWERGARAELTERAGEVRELVDELLVEIALGQPLAASTRARAVALEGHLRDRIRAGRLALEPLLSAVMHARERGVDVLLLDDLEGGLPEGFELRRVAVRLAAACDAAEDRVTVRILPAGRSAVLSLVVDGSPLSLPDTGRATPAPRETAGSGSPSPENH